MMVFERSGAAARQKATVLVVDDEIMIRFAIAEALRDHGFSVVEAGDGEEAIELLTAGVPADLMITDVRMPGRDGLHVARVARSIRPDLRIAVMTGHLTAADVSLPGVIDAFLPKPFAIAALLDLAVRLTREGE